MDWLETNHAVLSDKCQTFHCVPAHSVVSLHAHWVVATLNGSSSGQHWVISRQIKCRTAASPFLPVTTTTAS